MKTLHNLVADKLEQANPAARGALLRIPLENIDRWLANGHTAPHRLEQWRLILRHAQESSAGFQEFELGKYAWRARCHGLLELPIAA